VGKPAPARSGETAQAKRIERPRKLKWRHHAAAMVIFAGLRALSWTWRLRLVDEHHVLQSPIGPVILCLWHNRLALSMRGWERFGIPNIHSAGLVALISASHDGGVLARTLKYFNVEAVRGSSSRRGAQALLELTSWTDRNYTIAITPDGPRGPRYQIREGIVALAQLSGLPILPVSTCVNWKFCLRSWDRFQIPLPFSRCEVRIGKPILVGREVTDSQRAELKQQLENQMRSLTQD
jgi:lysophospholipid acyltransferase (LPLAT)-like uncharacterized protein